MRGKEHTNLNQLAIFACVMKFGSFSQAAEHLNTNQSTISTAMARLRQTLKNELFIRSGRGVTPTTFATNLYQDIREPIEQLNKSLQTHESFNPAESERRFVLAAPEHLQWTLLDSFSNNIGGKLSLAIYDLPEQEDASFHGLSAQKYDAMIDILPPSSLSFAHSHLFDGRFVVICRRDHPRIRGSMTENEFFQEQHAVLERTRHQNYSLAHFSNIDISKRNVVYFGRSLFNNLVMCAQSDLITIVPLSMAIHFQQRLQLQIITPPFAHKLMSNFIIWHKKHQHDPAHQWFRQAVETCLRASKQRILSEWKGGQK